MADKRKAKVWHITDFAELYELADDIRKKRSGPLRFTRSLVTLSPFASDAESRHFERMRCLRARPERHLLRSVFEDLKNWVAAKPFGMRGFLVTAEGKAAGCDYLAQQLMLSVDDLKQALPVLERLGFLERIPMDWQPEPRPKRPRTRGKTGSAKTSKKPGKKSEQKNRGNSKTAAKRTAGHSTKGLPESAGSSRNEPESVCPPSRKDNDKGKSKVKDNQKATSGLTAPGCKKNNNGNDKDDPQGKSNEQAPGPPTNPPLPSVPQESEAGGCRVTQFTGPPVTAEISRHGLAYGRRLYIALGYRYDIDSPEAAREIASFGSKHDKLYQRLSALSPPAVDAVLSRGLREAAKIAKRPANKNKGAVWHTVMDKLADAQQRSPP